MIFHVVSFPLYAISVAYQSQHPNYTKNFTFCQPLISHLFKILFAHLYFNQLAATSNGHEVEILFSEIDLGIQSHATFCLCKFNTAYTLPCTSDSLPNQFWPYQPGRIELERNSQSPLYAPLSSCALYSILLSSTMDAMP